MKIVVSEDNTGFAPADYRFAAYDDDSYDGAEDGSNMLGHGATRIAAVRDLLCRMDGDLDEDDALRDLNERIERCYLAGELTGDQFREQSAMLEQWEAAMKAASKLDESDNSVSL